MREDPPLEVTVATVVAERQASAGARDGVKGNRSDLAARAPLHALVRPPRSKVRSDRNLVDRRLKLRPHAVGAKGGTQMDARQDANQRRERVVAAQVRADRLRC